MNPSALRAYYARVYPFAKNFFQDRPVRILHRVGRELVLEESIRVLQTKSEFVWCGKAGALELHSLLSKMDKPSYPDWLVLDFEPGEACSFSKLKEAVGVANDYFTELNLQVLWKVSGHRGLHAMIPLRRLYRAMAVFDFAEMLTELIHEHIPRITRLHSTREMTSSADERILIDYHRNRFQHSVVAPFSPRAVAHPTLSLPLSWERLSAARNMPAFHFDVSDAVLKEASELLNFALEHPNDLEMGFVLMERDAREAG